MTHTEALQFVQEHPDYAAEAQAQMQAVLARSATDADFRARLLAEPRETLEAFAGRPVPETLNIVFVENGADATIVLPDFVDATAELSEAELEAVAGGTDVIFWTGVVLGATIVAGGAGIYAATR